MSANLADDFDWQDAQHQDELMRQRVLLEQLNEVHRLVDACSQYTWLNEKDVISIATECGLHNEYLKFINSPTAQGGKHG